VYYSHFDKLCEDHQNGNAISIIYDCINPGKINTGLLINCVVSFHESFILSI